MVQAKFTEHRYSITKWEKDLPAIGIRKWMNPQIKHVMPKSFKMETRRSETNERE
jgi:hypothetical protein